MMKRTANITIVVIVILQFYTVPNVFAESSVKVVLGGNVVNPIGAAARLTNDIRPNLHAASTRQSRLASH